MPPQRKDKMKKRPPPIKISYTENDTREEEEGEEEEEERDISPDSSSSFRAQNLSPAKRLNSPTAEAARNRYQDRPTIPVIVQDLKRPPRHSTASLLSPLAMKEKRHRRSVSSWDTDRTEYETEGGWEGNKEEKYLNQQQKVLDDMIEGLQLTDQPRHQQEEEEEEDNKSDFPDVDKIIHIRSQKLQPARKVLRRSPQKSALPGMVINAEVRDMKTGKLVKWPKNHDDEEEEEEEEKGV